MTAGPFDAADSALDPSPRSEPVSPLDLAIGRTSREPAGSRPPAAVRRDAQRLLDRFLSEPDPIRAILIWLMHCGSQLPGSASQALRRLNCDIAHIDALLSEQINRVLHHPQFQKLEASWRGLRYLIEQVPEGENIKVRMLDVSWRDLSRDLERAAEFDQSQLFQRIYNDEFGMPGGEPYGLLLGDYEIRPRPMAGHPIDDIATLRSMSTVAAAAFAPFVASAHASMFGLDRFAEFDQPIDLSATLNHRDNIKWNALRDTEDARFVGLVLPRILLRFPYKNDGTRADGFTFTEDVSGAEGDHYLWGNACYAFGAVVVRAIAQYGWPADIRGERDDDDEFGGGRVDGLAVHPFGTDRQGVVLKTSTDAQVTDRQEQELAELGFIPLCHRQGSDYATFFSNASIQRPKRYDEAVATVNARISSMLQYMLCVSRFAHYIKVIGRDKLGGFSSPTDCQVFLSNWLQNYVINDDRANIHQRASYPLREAQVEVRESPGRPGAYLCTIHLKPQYQLDQITTAVRLVTELGKSRGG